MIPCAVNAVMTDVVMSGMAAEIQLCICCCIVSCLTFCCCSLICSAAICTSKVFVLDPCLASILLDFRGDPVLLSAILQA
jgi:hypothetical protein